MRSALVIFCCCAHIYFTIGEVNSYNTIEKIAVQQGFLWNEGRKSAENMIVFKVDPIKTGTQKEIHFNAENWAGYI